MKVFSSGLAILQEWRIIGFLKGYTRWNKIVNWKARHWTDWGGSIGTGWVKKGRREKNWRAARNYNGEVREDDQAYRVWKAWPRYMYKGTFCIWHHLFISDISGDVTEVKNSISRNFQPYSSSSLLVLPCWLRLIWRIPLAKKKKIYIYIGASVAEWI